MRWAVLVVIVTDISVDVNIARHRPKILAGVIGKRGVDGPDFPVPGHNIAGQIAVYRRQAIPDVGERLVMAIAGLNIGGEIPGCGRCPIKRLVGTADHPRGRAGREHAWGGTTPTNPGLSRKVVVGVGRS